MRIEPISASRKTRRRGGGPQFLQRSKQNSRLPSTWRTAPPLRCGWVNPDFLFTRVLLFSQPASVCLLVGGVDHQQNKESRRSFDLTMLSRTVFLGAQGFKEPQRFFLLILSSNLAKRRLTVKTLLHLIVWKPILADPLKA